METKTTRKRGCVFQKPNSRFYYITYSHRGKRYRESTHSTSEAFAQRLLDKRLREIDEEGTPGVVYERVKFEELARDLRNDYIVNTRKTLARIEQSIAHLSKSFGGIQASRINTATVKEYVAKRLGEGAAHGTINRELTALKRMFSLGLQCEKVNRKPFIPMLEEDNVREGFLEYEQFLMLRDHLPEHLKPLVTVAYMTGLRRGELVNLDWKRVFISLPEAFIRLGPKDTKNGRPRTIYLPKEALEALLVARKNRRPDCPLVFHLNGKKLGDFRKSWDSACNKAGVPGLLLHDLRRSAVRNFVRSQIPERVAMQMSGHLTRSIFDRYNIVSEKDLQDAARLLDAHLEQQKQPRVSRLPG